MSGYFALVLTLSTLILDDFAAQRVPFEVTFLSDATEVATDPENEGGRAQKGFKMSFTQDRNCIFPELEP